MITLVLCMTGAMLAFAQDTCPGLLEGTPPTQNASVPALPVYNFELNFLNIMDVVDDIRALMSNSQECWPADTYNNVASYGPLFIRLAWHCSGTFRDTDGAGGCGGGRQRFGPEASWGDNTNLDKARALLAPIKEKHGDKLSWGDLMVFAGTAAILDMGGPITEICAGRVDSPNGEASFPLGPTPVQEDCCPCPEQGNCQEPLGADTIGLIYVNPEGYMGNNVPDRSAEQIRNVFGRMDMSDRETVALIGGGHAFGKCHGACDCAGGACAGTPPDLDPFNPWQGLCGTGKGTDTYTSGYEGAWTNSPLSWDNQFFQRLMNDEYQLVTGPGGKGQWKNVNNDLMMLTSDLALVNDDAYLTIVQEFATDINALNEAFANAWAKLTKSGGVWAANQFCIYGELEKGKYNVTRSKK